MNKKRTKRNHDGFFKYVYSDPANARAMLRTLSKGNGSVKRILSNVNLDTLEEISERYDNVDERGEADIAFKATTNTGEPFYFGILLEHKSEHKVNVLEQTFRYAFNVMVDKSNTTFKWLPTKAIIIYNGTDSWDPLAEFRKQPHGNFEGRELPFECAFVDLKLECVDCNGTPVQENGQYEGDYLGKKNKTIFRRVHHRKRTREVEHGIQEFRRKAWLCQRR